MLAAFLWFDCPLYFCPVGLGVVVIFLCIVIFLDLPALLSIHCDGCLVGLSFVRFGLFTA